MCYDRILISWASQKLKPKLQFPLDFLHSEVEHCNNLFIFIPEFLFPLKVQEIRKSTVNTNIKINNYLINVREGFTVKLQTEGWNFLFHGPSLWARSIKQKFSPKSGIFTVKPEKTRLLSCLLLWLQVGKARKIEGISTLPSVSVTISFCSISCFFNEVSFSESH